MSTLQRLFFCFFSRISTAVPALQEVEVTFGGRVIKINRVQTTRYLGVIVDQNLSWKAHITSLRLKLGRNVGVMHRFKFFLPFCALKSIYFSLFHSYINYCSIPKWKSTVEISFVIIPALCPRAVFSTIREQERKYVYINKRTLNCEN